MRTVIADCRISYACERALALRGFNVIKLPPHKRLGEDIASHPDMLLLKHGNTVITSADYCDMAPHVFSDLREYASELKISFTSDEQRAEYPHDALFNALIMGDKIFCRRESISPSVLALADECGMEVIGVRQGYPACTVLALSDSIAITADRGMARALTENGITVTLIENGDIELPPHEYGFIGGAAGVFEGRVYFLGSLDAHRDKEKIIDACRAAKVTPVSLSDEKLRDLGRLIFI